MMSEKTTNMLITIPLQKTVSRTLNLDNCPRGTGRVYFNRFNNGSALEGETVSNVSVYTPVWPSFRISTITRHSKYTIK